MNFEGKMLEFLEEEEIKTVVSHMDIGRLLNPMKNNPQMYSQQVKKLGRMDAKSPLVQKVLPRIVVNQVKKQDVTYSKIVTNYLKEVKQDFANYLKEYEMTNTLSPEVPESYATLYWRYKKEIDKLCDLPYFWVLLKIVDKEFDTIEQIRVEYCIEQQANNLQMIAEYENKINLLNSDHQIELEQLKKKHFKEIKELQQEIRNLSDLIQGKKESLEEIWKNETEKMHSQRMESLLEEYNQKREGLEKRYNEANIQLDKGYKEKKELFLSEIENQTSQLQSKFESKKKMLNEDIGNMQVISQTLHEKEDLLRAEIEALETRKSELQTYIDHYFQQFEEHAIQLKLDALLTSKFSQRTLELLSKKTSEEAQTIQLDQNELLSYGGEPVKNGEYIEPVDESENVLEDLKDNIELFFEDSYEIAKLLLVSQSLKKAVLVDSFSAKKIGDSLSALSDGKYVTIVDLNDDKYTLKAVIDFINDMPEKTILVDGVIDRFDDKALSSICRNCRDKILIFSYAEKSTLEIISKSYLQYCIPLFLEEKLTFESREELLISNQTYHNFLPEVGTKECHQAYQKYIQKLFYKGHLTKSLALELSKFIAIYKAMTRGGNVSDLAKETIRFYVSDNGESEEVRNWISNII
jgi:hypothetical protein